MRLSLQVIFTAWQMNPQVPKNANSSARKRAPVSVVPLMFMLSKSSGTSLILMPHKNTGENKKFLEKVSRENSSLWRSYYIQQQGVHLQLLTHCRGRICIVYRKKKQTTEDTREINKESRRKLD